jgi:hypothetical protein
MLAGFIRLKKNIKANTVVAVFIIVRVVVLLSILGKAFLTLALNIAYTMS